MRIKLKIDPDLTKEQLIERLPTLVKSITETLLEKGAVLGNQINGATWKSHPIRAIAKAEDQLTAQGSDALAGIYSWLMRNLRVDIQKGGLSNDDYRHEMVERYGIKLGDKVTYDQAREIEKVFSTLPDDASDGRVEAITVDGRYGNTQKRYPNHGRYLPDEKRVILNPAIFGDETPYTDGNGKPISKLQQTLLHELGHAYDDKHKISSKKEWRDLSGWRYIGDKDAPEDHDRLMLEEGGKTSLKGKWAYRKGTEFARWYGARNPKEDFCEAFTFAMLGAHQYFKGESGQKKLAFVNNIIARLIKSEVVLLTDDPDEEIVKSQEFQNYLSVRLETLLEKSEADEVVEIAKAEFLDETCHDLFFKADQTPMPTPPPDRSTHGTPAPKAVAKFLQGMQTPSPAPAAAGEGVSHQVGPNPQKGQERPGHKYIKRELLPNGKYRYWYSMPTGQHYHSETPLHDEAVHKPQITSETHWGNYRQNLASHQILQEPPPGIKPHFFDDTKPDLVQDIKPGAKQFDPKAEPGEKRVEGEAAAKRIKPKREEMDLRLHQDDAKAALAAQKTYEIEKIDPDFGVGGGNNVNPTMRPKLKNDGEGIMKLQAASHTVISQYGHLRQPINEFSTVFREVAAYRIDSILKWNIVPPTNLRVLKGNSLKRVIDHLLKRFRILSYSAGKKVIEDLKSKKMLYASIQFFSKGGDTHGKLGRQNLPIKERQHWMLFDMMINHQDRHRGNIFYADEQDDKRKEYYGQKEGKKRFIGIDNGLSLGNGEMTGQAEIDWRENKDFVLGTFLDKDTLRDMRRLRDDLINKKRRRKVLGEEVLSNIPMDQINRVVHRIDWILRNENRDAKGRVKFPDWHEMVQWETKKFPKKYDKKLDAQLAKAYQEQPYDVAGQTDMVNYHRDRVNHNVPDPLKGLHFQTQGEIRKFLRPLDAYLNAKQKTMLGKAVDYIGDPYNRDYGYGELRKFIDHAPKRLLDQMFNKQLFLDRLAKHFPNDRWHERVRDKLQQVLDADHQKEFEGHLKIGGGTAAVEKHRKGELTRDEAIKLVGPDDYAKAEGRWAVHPNQREVLRGEGTSAFEGGSTVGKNPSEARKEFWDPRLGSENPAWLGGKNYPRGGVTKSDGDPDLIVSLED